MNKQNPSKIILTSKGRISRKTFWRYIGFSFLITLLAIVLFAFMFTAASSLPAYEGEVPSSNIGISHILAMMLMAISIIYASFISIFGYIRRLHDLDKSGWISLILLIPYIGAFALLIYCGCVKGRDGANKYGDHSNCL